MKPKFRTLLTLIVVAGLLVLAGCGPKPTEAPPEKPAATEAPPEPTEAPPEPTEAPPEPAAEEAVMVTIFVGFGTGTSAEQMAVHEEIAEDFNSTHEDIQIEFLTVPWEERIAKFSTMLAGDMAPDIVMPIGVGGISEFYEEWMDISPYIERDNYDLSDYYGTTVELHTYPDKGLVGLPIGVYPTVVFYNEDLLDAAGLDYPPHEWEAPYADGDPWTYDKLVEIGKELTLDSDGNNANSPAFNWENTVQWGWNGWDWMTPKEFPQKFGGINTGVSEDNKTALMNSEGWVAMMEWIKDTIWTWHIRATGEQSGAFYDVAGDPMGSGMVGMWECHSWMAWAYSSWTEAFNWDVAAVPAVEGFPVMAPVHADTFVIPKSSHHPDEAWEVAKWLFEPDMLMRLAKNYGCIPARQSLAQQWLDDMAAEFPNVDWVVFLGSIDYIDDPQHEKWTPEYSKIYDAVQAAHDLIATGENLNVQEVMDNLNAEAQGYLDEYWASQ
jgi:multiple sugar transport system substrate-binding protein